MRGVPDHNQERPCVPPAPPCPAPITFTPRDPSPDPLAELGREVLEKIPCKQRGSLEAYRRAANDLSLILRASGVKIKPKALYYTALRQKWLDDNINS